VSYDITFLWCAPGVTPLQAVERANAEHDSEEPATPLPLTAQERDAFARIVARVAAEVTVSTDEYRTHLEIVCEEPALIVDYFGSSAGLSMPYWYVADRALSAMTRAYWVAGIIAAETGLVPLDSQTQLMATAENLDAAIAAYGTTMTRVARIVQADRANPDAAAEREKYPAADSPGRPPGYSGLRLEPGDRVSHAAFGTGTVVTATEPGDDAQAKIKFDSEAAGSKTFALRFVNLRKI
jgi:hypothetical protein